MVHYSDFISIVLSKSDSNIFLKAKWFQLRNTFFLNSIIIKLNLEVYKMKILFVYPSWTGDYGIIAHFARRAGIYPPLNLALLAAICEREGHEAEIIGMQGLR